MSLLSWMTKLSEKIWAPVFTFLTAHSGRTLSPQGFWSLLRGCPFAGDHWWSCCWPWGLTLPTTLQTSEHTEICFTSRNTFSRAPDHPSPIFALHHNLLGMEFGWDSSTVLSFQFIPFCPMTLTNLYTNDSLAMFYDGFHDKKRCL